MIVFKKFSIYGLVCSQDFVVLTFDASSYGISFAASTIV